MLKESRLQFIYLMSTRKKIYIKIISYQKKNKVILSNLIIFLKIVFIN